MSERARHKKVSSAKNSSLRKTSRSSTNSAAIQPPATDLTAPEVDLLAHIDDGYQLETDSLGANPVLRNLKDDEVIRPVSVNRGTVEALQKRGVIKSGKGDEPLTLVWRRTRS